MSMRSRESKMASRLDCPVGDIVFGGFVSTPMGQIRQTPEQAKEAEEFWAKANAERAKKRAELEKEIADYDKRTGDGNWLRQSIQILQECIGDGTSKAASAMAQENRRGHASVDCQSAIGTNPQSCGTDGEGNHCRCPEGTDASV